MSIRDGKERDDGSVPNSFSNVPHQVHAGERKRRMWDILHDSVYSRHEEFSALVAESIAPPLAEVTSEAALSTMMEDFQLRNPECFKDFLDLIFELGGVFDRELQSQLLHDDELSVLFTELFQLEFGDKSGREGRYDLLRSEIIERISKAVQGHGTQLQSQLPLSAPASRNAQVLNLSSSSQQVAERFDRIYGNFALVKRLEELRDAILATGNTEAIRIWHTEIASLDEDYRSGKISSFQKYHTRLEHAYSTAIEKADDEKLNDLWADYKESTDDVEFVEDIWFSEKDVAKDAKIEPEDPNDESITEEEIKAAVADVSDLGFDVRPNFAANVAHLVDGDVVITISVYRNSLSKQNVYYLDDKFSKVRPLRVEAEDVLSVLYDRHVDALISSSLSDDPEAALEVAELDDNLLINTAKMFLGDEVVKNYRVSDIDKKVLKVLAEILKFQEQDTSLESKFSMLSGFITTKSQGEKVARELLDGTVTSIEDIVGEDYFNDYVT